MKRGDYVASRTKKTLLAKKWNGEKEVVWKLTPTQLEVVKSYFRVEPCLYTIKTRPFSNIRNLNYQKISTAAVSIVLMLLLVSAAGYAVYRLVKRRRAYG